MTLRAVAATQLVQVAAAGDGIWTSPGSASWASSVSWAGSNIANGIQASAAFNSVDLTGNVTVTLDGNKTAGHLTFADTNPSHQWYLRAGSGGTLALDAGGVTPIIHVANQTATVGVSLAGSAGISKTGGGTLVLAGANSYSGPTSVQSGTLRLETQPVFPSGMRIMPMGDSITYGFDGSNAGYRGPLYGLLLPLVPDFRYIGTSLERPGSLPSQPIDQRYHEGHSSYRIQDTSNNLDGYDNARFLELGGPDRDPNGGYWITGGNGTGRAPAFPDIITMMLGHNDLSLLPGAEARLHGLIAKITTLRPDCHLCVAKIIPVPGNPGVAPYNQIVANVVAGFQALGKKVHLVDLNTNFPTNGLSGDAIHPNDTGFNWMAIQWHEAIIEACTPEGGPSLAIPEASQVTVNAGATLDLDGNLASLGIVNSSGTVDLGEGGGLTTQRLLVTQTGGIGGTGTIHGPVVNNSTIVGEPGHSLTFTGQFTNNRALDTTHGASLHFQGTFINNGTLAGGPGAIPEFTGQVINNGIIRLTGGADLTIGGSFVNNGVLDLITAGQVASADFANHGVVINEKDVKVESVTTSSTHLHLSVHSHTGHIYQLQKSAGLASGSWANEGAPQSGISGMLLNFTAVRESEQGFYRIRVSP